MLPVLVAVLRVELLLQVWRHLVLEWTGLHHVAISYDVLINHFDLLVLPQLRVINVGIQQVFLYGPGALALGAFEPLAWRILT